tara:strand:- start:1564 stop:1779 length:216 start_codon:yes stop_codon:yes gene_type:complete
MLADKKLKRKKPIKWDNKEQAINNLYPEGVAMAMVFSEEVYLCVTDLEDSSGSSIYEISKNGDISKISLSA